MTLISLSAQMIIDFLRKNGETSRADLSKNFQITGGVIGDLIQAGLVRYTYKGTEVYYSLK